MGSCFCVKRADDIDHISTQIKAPTRSNMYDSHSKSNTHTTDRGAHNDNRTPDLMQPLIDQNITSLGAHIIPQNTDNFKTFDHSDIDSIIEEDKLTLLTMEQSNQLRQDGYCMLKCPLNRDIQIRYVVEGYIRENYNGCIVKELIRQIVYYYGTRFNTKMYIELVCNKLNPIYFLVPRRNIILSNVLKDIDKNVNKIELNEYTENEPVGIDIVYRVLRYLGHHKGEEPDPLPCPVRSIHMAQIVSDKWDADYMDAFEKKEIFEIIILANQLKIQCLLHLGCAKIATLIKQLDQKEINKIIEEEEKYRREHAQNDDETDNGNGDNDEEKEKEKGNMNEAETEVNNDMIENDEEKAKEKNETTIERKCSDLVDKNSDEYEENVVLDEENE